MACRSSVAEITGNSRIMAQPRAQKKTAGRSEPVEQVRCRHSKKAGSSKDSQQRLRRSSIPDTRGVLEGQYPHNPVQLPQDNQDSTGAASDLRTRRAGKSCYGPCNTCKG